MKDLVSENAQPNTSEVTLPTDVKKDLLSGTSVLGLSMAIERGCSFLANILAARFGGASTFGAYSLAISTANNISAYAAGGIGSTAIRFSGEHQKGSPGYPTLARALAVISMVSALIAGTILWTGAGPIATLLKKESLTGVLQWAAFSAAGIILLECCRGFLVGQKSLRALLLLSGVVGAGLLSLLPLTAHWGPTPMICSQSGVFLGAVLLCLLCYRPLGLASPPLRAPAEPLGPLLKQVWSFGLMQLGSFVGMYAAGWWLTSLVARSDSSMTQMGFFAAAHQIRNLVALAPSLLTESSIGVMASRNDEESRTPDHVMATCTYVCTAASFVLAGLGIIVIPWALTVTYGKTFAGAVSVAAIALATAVAHMGSGPASARLSIVSIRAAGAINTFWAICVAGLSTAFLLKGGNATKGATIYLVAHLVSAGLQFLILRRRGHVPAQTLTVFVIGTSGAILLALLAISRVMYPENQGILTLAMLCLFAVVSSVLFAVGRTRGWLPSADSVMSVVARVIARRK